MAVYTEVGRAQVQALLTRLGLGELRALTPILGGIENTNYFVDTNDPTAGSWVLTLFERLRADQLPFYLHLMQHLASRGLPVPEPRADAQGQLVHHLAGKPAALVNRLPGQSVEAPDLHHCAQVGGTLARMHLAVQDFERQQAPARGLPWWEATAPTVRPFLTAWDATLLDEELAFQHRLAASPAHAALPRGAVHADLFRDNALFAGLPGSEQLSGVFDFYFAGVDTFAYDLAVTLNDWCVDLGNGHLVVERAEAMVRAYQGERGCQPEELRLLPALRRAAALRFWLSRLSDWHAPRDASLLQAKDPSHFERVLRQAIARPWHPLD